MRALAGLPGKPLYLLLYTLYGFGDYRGCALVLAEGVEPSIVVLCVIPTPIGIMKQTLAHSDGFPNRQLRKQHSVFPESQHFFSMWILK